MRTMSSVVSNLEVVLKFQKLRYLMVTCVLDGRFIGQDEVKVPPKYPPGYVYIFIKTDFGKIFTSSFNFSFLNVFSKSALTFLFFNIPL